MNNFKLTIEYDGTDFVGWQRQPNGRSVQEILERTLSQLTGEKCDLVGAGRTDSGVHARGQVANVKIETKLLSADILRALNGMLPEDIAIRNAEDVPMDFSARYSAKSRLYRYHISTNRTALLRRNCWQLFYPLQYDLLCNACDIIAVTEDFQSFCKAEAEVEHFRCKIHEAQWSGAENGMLIFSIKANRFLHGMVRSLVGTMVDIARGHIPFDELKTIIASKDRRRAGMAAPPQGLFLESVEY
jgi:tRNA pseudouridine38-40 synthase